MSLSTLRLSQTLSEDPQRDHPQVILILDEVSSQITPVPEYFQRFKKFICSSRMGRYTGYHDFSRNIKTKAISPWALWNIYRVFLQPLKRKTPITLIFVEVTKPKPPVPEHSETFINFICRPSTGSFPGYPSFRWSVWTKLTSPWTHSKI